MYLKYSAFIIAFKILRQYSIISNMYFKSEKYSLYKLTI